MIVKIKNNIEPDPQKKSMRIYEDYIKEYIRNTCYSQIEFMATFVYWKFEREGGKVYVPAGTYRVVRRFRWNSTKVPEFHFEPTSENPTHYLLIESGIYRESEYGLSYRISGHDNKVIYSCVRSTGGEYKSKKLIAFLKINEHILLNNKYYLVTEDGLQPRTDLTETETTGGFN